MRAFTARRAAALAACAALALPPAAHAAAAHPLDPLSADELAALGEVLRASERFSPGTHFAWAQLEEPPKALVEAFRPGEDFPRRATVHAIDYARGRNYAVRVDLRSRRIERLAALDAQPGLDRRDFRAAGEVIDADPAVAQALRRRGLQVPGKPSASVHLLFMPLGHDPRLAAHPGRLVRVLFSSDPAAKNSYGPVLEGLMAVVDVHAGRMVRLVDRPGPAPVKVAHDVFDPAVVRTPAPPPAAPAGARGFVLEGNALRWQSWRMRYGFNLREGLVLYQLAFADGASLRPVAYRVSVAEVATAYASPQPFWSWLELLDQSTFGLGYSAIPARAGHEAPANALLLSPPLPLPEHARFGAPAPERIYVYERDAGNLVHYAQDGRTVHARATELVIGWFASLGNYLYGFNWVFRQDGSFGFEAELGGQVLTHLGAAHAARAVHPGVSAMHHQHWFNLRLDFDVDGARNAARERNAVPLGDKRGFRVPARVFRRALEARRDAREASARRWTVYSPRTGGGYTLALEGGARHFFPPARARGAMGFAFHNFWVTPYREGELYAAGRYPTQARPGYADALFHYANADPIYDRDIVAWVSVGETHVTRPEDWPLMSNARLAVRFRPEGFFHRNPALGEGPPDAPAAPATKRE